MPISSLARRRGQFEQERSRSRRATARQLRSLTRRGWVLVDGIATGRGTLDHALIGPGGVFLLESKRLPGVVSVERGVLIARRREGPDDYENHWLAPRMCAAAAELADRLRRTGAPPVWVQPVVVLWGRFDPPSTESGGVAWIHGKQLAATFRRRARALDSDQVDTLAAALAGGPLGH